jgi:pimeloyl-ACP methyl ester carboxylesterase
MSQESLPGASPTESAPPAPRIAERGIVVNGVRIATAMSEGPRELLARLPLVVLLEAGFVWRDYAVVLDRFAPERRVFALDWPGFGASAKPAPADFTYSTHSFAKLLSAWLDALGIARAVLLGNGVGAIAALRYAVAHPTRVLGLALVAPLGFAQHALLAGLARRLTGSPFLLRRIEPLVTSLLLGPTSPDVTSIAHRHRELRTAADCAASIQALAALSRSLAATEVDLSTLASQITAPSLVLRGALDPLVTAAEVHRAASSIGARGALEVTLPDAGHLPFLQQPDRFHQALAGLINAAESATPPLS